MFFCSYSFVLVVFPWHIPIPISWRRSFGRDNILCYNGYTWLNNSFGQKLCVTWYRHMVEPWYPWLNNCFGRYWYCPHDTCVIALRWWWLLKVAAIPWCRVQEMVLWDGYCHPKKIVYGTVISGIVDYWVQNMKWCVLFNGKAICLMCIHANLPFSSLCAQGKLTRENLGTMPLFWVLLSRWLAPREPWGAQTINQIDQAVSSLTLYGQATAASVFDLAIETHTCVSYLMQRRLAFELGVCFVILIKSSAISAFILFLTQTCIPTYNIYIHIYIVYIYVCIYKNTYKYVGPLSTSHELPLRSWRFQVCLHYKVAPRGKSGVTSFRMANTGPHQEGQTKAAIRRSATWDPGWRSSCLGRWPLWMLVDVIQKSGGILDTLFYWYIFLGCITV